MDEDVTTDDFVSETINKKIKIVNMILNKINYVLEYKIHNLYSQVGMAIIKLSALCINNGVRDWFQINYKNKSAGQVL